MPLQYFSTSFGRDEEEEEEEEEEVDDEDEEVVATPDEGVRSRKSASASKVLPQLLHVGLELDSSELWCEIEKRVTWQMGQARSKVVVVVEEEEGVEVDDDAQAATRPRFDAFPFAPTLAGLGAAMPLRFATERGREHVGGTRVGIGTREAEGGARASMMVSSLERGSRWCVDETEKVKGGGGKFSFSLLRTSK